MDSGLLGHITTVAPPALMVSPRFAVLGSRCRQIGHGQPLEGLLAREVGAQPLHDRHVCEHPLDALLAELVFGHDP